MTINVRGQYNLLIDMTHTRQVQLIMSKFPLKINKIAPSIIFCTVLFKTKIFFLMLANIDTIYTGIVISVICQYHRYNTKNLTIHSVAHTHTWPSFVNHRPVFCLWFFICVNALEWLNTEEVDSGAVGSRISCKEAMAEKLYCISRREICDIQ